MAEEPTQPQLTWLTPIAAAQLLAPLYTDFPSAQMVLIEHASAGLVRSFCRRRTDTPTVVHAGSAVTLDNVWIDRSFWEAFSDLQRRTFVDWGTGSFGANIFQGRQGEKSWWRVRVFHVWFCEEDIRAIRGVAPKPIADNALRSQNLENWGRLIGAFQDSLKSATPEARLTPDTVARPATKSPRKKPGKAPVSHPEFKDWFDALPPVDQAKGYRWLWAQAKLHFRPRHVPKKWATEIVKGRVLGRKPKG